MLMGSDMIPALRQLCMLLFLLAPEARRTCAGLLDKIWTNCTNGLCWSARYKHQECLKILASDGADFGLVNSAGQSARVIAESARGALGFRQAVVDVIRSGEIVQSSNTSVFSPLMLVTQANGIEALKKLIEGADIDHNEQDEKGYSAAMIAVEGGYDSCRGRLPGNFQIAYRRWG